MARINKEDGYKFASTVLQLAYQLEITEEIVTRTQDYLSTLTYEMKLAYLSLAVANISETYKLIHNFGFQEECVSYEEVEQYNHNVDFFDLLFFVCTAILLAPIPLYSITIDDELSYEQAYDKMFIEKAPTLI